MERIEEENDIGGDCLESVTAQDYIASQAALEREAKEVMPYDPNKCTYSTGALRQNVYACLTCFKEDSKMAGICYSCSIQCHPKHELVELFSKRDFTCDCGTTRMKFNGACRLRTGAYASGSRRSSFSSNSSQEQMKLPSEDVPSSSNNYNHNFEGTFCSCSKPYNPLQETGSMLQCYFGAACGEDWFHDECIMGFEPGFMVDCKRAPITKNEESVNLLESLPEPDTGVDAAEADVYSNNDTESNDNGNGDDTEPFPGFPSLDDFDCFICWKCVAKFKDAMDEIPDDIIANKLVRIKAGSVDERVALLGNSQDDEFVTKKRKIDRNYSIFLKYDFKEQLHVMVNDQDERKKHLVSVLKMFPYLHQADPIYEPDADPDLEDDNSSIYDMGSKVLENMPREKAIESVRAYQAIKTRLTDFLKPFAEHNKVVTESEVRDFFKRMNEEKQ